MGGNIENSELHITIKEVIKSGVSIVAAAGNFGDGDGLTDEITFPGYYKELYQIGAVDYNLKVTNFSNSNGNIDFVAPGTDILSTFKNGQYAKLSGTSMAAPHVSGAIALLLNVIKVNFKTPADIVFDYLVKNAESTGRSFKEEGYGFFRLSKGAIQIGRQSKYLDNCNK